MRVLFLSRLYKPHIGGVEKHISEISKGLIKISYKITLVTTIHQKGLSFNERIGGVNVMRFNQPKIKYFGLFYTWIWLLLNINLIKKSDIIHCHDVFIWYLPFRFLFPKKPVYTTLHGWEGIYPIPKKNILHKKVARIFSKKLLSVGEYVKKYYGIKADSYTYGAVNVPSKIPKKKTNLIVYVGRLERDTGLIVILNVLKQLRGFKVIFCGDGSLSKECKKHGQVLGVVNPSKYLAKATFCFAGGYLSAIEALSYKCIVLTVYDNPFRRDAFRIGPFNKLIIIENSPKKLAEKIKYYYENPKKAKKITNKGYQWARKQSWNNLTNKYINLWEAN